MGRKVFRLLSSLFVMILLLSAKTVYADDAVVDIRGQASVQNAGWAGEQSATAVGNIITLGTPGSGLHVEALRLRADNDPNLDIQYSAYVQGSGWQGDVTGASTAATGQCAGTTGQGLAIEALKMNLTGASQNSYDINYRVYVGNIGWMGWTSNGAPAGTTNASLSVQAVQIRLIPKGSGLPPQGDAATTASYIPAAVYYQTHVQNVGWTGETTNGQISGTTGRGLRVEAMKIRTEDPSVMGISYQAHVQNIGWQNPVPATASSSDGVIAGTTGRGLRVEAVRISLTGEASRFFDVWYRAHVQNFGWMAWTSNGNSAGTAGMAFRVEALQIMVLPKGQQPTAGPAASTSYPFLGTDNIYCQAHVQNIGWQAAVKNGATAGTTGRSLRVEAIRLSTDAPGLGVSYRSHIQNIGWEDTWHSSGDSGTTGRGLRLEAMQIKLTGDASKYFDVYYRVHVQNFGWLGWAKNGESAGSEGYGYRMEALQVVIRYKGQGAPGSTARAYMVKPQFQDEMDAKANGYSSRTPYLILVNCGSHQVNIYNGSQNNWTRVQSYSCGNGAAGSPTIHGEFTVGIKEICFGHGYTCWYATQIYGDYLFHSVLYYPGSQSRVMDGRLGQAVSHGCVRLAIENAKWIYDNIPSGTKVVVYN